MSEDPKTLIAEATKVLADAETFLDLASQSILSIPARREEAEKNLTAVREYAAQAWQEYQNVIREDLSSQVHEYKAEEKYDRARERVAGDVAYLTGEAFDTEYRKAVARQIAGLLREDLTQTLDDIAARSGDQELQKIVAGYKDELLRATYRLIKTFPAARELLLTEVRKARAEARKILDGFDSLPVG